MGFEQLAEEIIAYTQIHSPRREWKVIVECGTGTTAFFLHRHLKAIGLPVEVIAVPCVGSEDYLLQQMRQLDSAAGASNDFPFVLAEGAPRVFAKPYQEHMDIWWDLISSTGIVFDLIYTPRAMEQVIMRMQRDPAHWKDVELMYVHCGGNSGIGTQLRRYQRDKTMVIPEEALRRFG